MAKSGTRADKEASSRSRDQRRRECEYVRERGRGKERTRAKFKAYDAVEGITILDAIWWRQFGDTFIATISLLLLLRLPFTHLETFADGIEERRNGVAQQRMTRYLWTNGARIPIELDGKCDGSVKDQGMNVLDSLWSSNSTYFLEISEFSSRPLLIT